MRMIYARLVLYMCFCACIGLQARDGFEKVGDVLTLAPIGVLVVSMGLEDYEGALQLTASALVTQGIIEIVKKSLEFAHNRGVEGLGFAKRPCCEDWKGMPSGHAGGGFSAAGFVYYRYGWKQALPLIALGLITDASRVYARKHSVLQVAAGSVIAWGVAKLMTSTYKPRVLLLPHIEASPTQTALSMHIYTLW